MLDHVALFSGGYEREFRDPLEAKCRELDLDLLLVFGNGIAADDALDAAYNGVFDHLASDRIAGLIALSTCLAAKCGHDGIARFLRRYAGKPLCSVGVDVPGVPSVTVDNRLGMQSVVEHILRDHDCRRVVFLAGTPGSPESETRYRIYRELLDRHRIHYDPALVVEGGFVRTAAHAAMQGLLERRVEFDAVVAANDHMALGAIEALRQHGRRVPHDVPVTGFDDVVNARLGDPPLTTVAQPFVAMARAALQSVLDQTEGRAVADCIELPAEFVVRRSCGCGAQPGAHEVGTMIEGQISAVAFVRDHAEKIRSSLAASLGTCDPDGAQAAGQLLEALQAELQNGTPSFLGAIDDVVERVGHDGEGALALQQTIGSLRRMLRSVATSELEDLWSDARDRIAQASAHGQLAHRNKLDDTFVQMLAIDREIAAPLDLPFLQRALVRAFPAAGIRTAFLLRYPDGDTDHLESFVCVRNGEQWHPLAARFAASDLLPPGAYSPQRRHTLLVLPVIVEGERWGVLVFEHNPGMVGLQILRDQIANALRYVGLHHKVVQKTKLHERSVQERLAATKRMQSLSVLAGGVAHDLNNALGPLVGLPDVMLRELDHSDPAQKAFAELRRDLVAIKGAAQRASQTIKDLLTLGRQGRMTREPLDLNRAVAGCLTSTNPQLVEAAGRRVDIVVDVPEEPIIVKASEAQLARAVTNLVRNAIEALPRDGQVVIRTRETCVVEPTAGYETIPPGDYAVVSVSDTGEGIPADLLSWVFEPFASRKRLGEGSGTGLGLAIVHGVAKEHGGFVDVCSALGQGTTFSLYLPCARARVRSYRPNSAAPRGSARILIVDDEPIQLRTGRRILTHLGYEVDTMASGAEAHRLLARCAAKGQRPYDLVILDMLLNEDRDGLEIFEQIQQLFPEQRAIVASGHAPTERAEQARTRGLAWLAKPYTPEALARVVRSALAMRPGQAAARPRLGTIAGS